MNDGHPHPHLRAFVLGSLAVHALLFVGWRSSSVWFGALPQPPLSVRLEGVSHADSPERPSTRVARATPNHERARRDDAAVEPASRTTRADTGRERVPNTSAPAETGNDNELRARIEARVRLDLARHFEYPHVARLRGWEGDVLLGFVVQASGRLDGIRVLRGSGFAVLDRSAVDSLRHVARLPEAVAWLNGRDLEVRLPILYRLEGER